MVVGACGGVVVSNPFQCVKWVLWCIGMGGLILALAARLGFWTTLASSGRLGGGR